MKKKSVLMGSLVTGITSLVFSVSEAMVTTVYVMIKVFPCKYGFACLLDFRFIYYIPLFAFIFFAVNYYVLRQYFFFEKQKILAQIAMFLGIASIIMLVKEMFFS